MQTKNQYNQRRHEERTKIVIVIEGGCLRDVWANSPHVEVELYDMDNAKAQADQTPHEQELSDYVTTEVPHQVF